MPTPTGSAKKPQNVQKEDAMWLQKELINKNYMELATARANNRKVSATFVPGNLNELLMCFDFARSLPETNALQNGMRKKSGKMIMDAERDGQSEDVCTYVKADLGMMMGGEIGPTGDPMPRPDMLLLSYTGCFTFMKWFELIRHKYGCETVMLHVPYQGEGKIAPNMRDYVVKQLKETVIPTLERISGVKFDIDRLRQYMRESVKAEDDLVKVLQSAKNRPQPDRRLLRRRLLHRPDLHRLPRHARGHAVLPHAAAPRSTSACAWARARHARRRHGRGEVPPGRRRPAELDQLPRLLEDVLRRRRGGGASTYAKVGGLYDFGFRHDPDHPLESLAEYCLGCYTNLNLPSRVDMICKYIDEYQADGLLINSIKSCNSFSAGQLLILREVEKRTGKPAAFIETDLVDPRYFSAANVKNRLESYFQMVKQKRTYGHPDPGTGRHPIHAH
jgi:benzoyl-CoA reductase subunit B